MYSQNNEEQIILDYFREGKRGKLLDIGANDGITFSNSAKFIELGWSAVLVEPSPVAYSKLKKQHADAIKEGRVITLDVAIREAAQPGKMILHESGSLITENDHSLVSTVVESEKERFPAVSYSPVQVTAWTIEQMLSYLGVYGECFDFISIDAEGLDFAILTQINLANTDMVCVEYNGIDPEKYIAYCAGFGLKEIHRNGENLIFAR